MEYVNLGRSGLKVSRACLGAMNFGTSNDAPCGEAEARRINRRCRPQLHRHGERLHGRSVGTDPRARGGRPAAFGGDGWPFPNAKERIAQLAEAIRICRLMWTETPANFEGQYYQIKDAYCEPVRRVIPASLPREPGVLRVGPDRPGPAARGAVRGAAEKGARARHPLGHPIRNAHGGIHGSHGAPGVRALREDELPAGLAVPGHGLAGGAPRPAPPDASTVRPTPPRGGDALVRAVKSGGRESDEGHFPGRSASRSPSWTSEVPVRPSTNDQPLTYSGAVT